MIDKSDIQDLAKVLDQSKQLKMLSASMLVCITEVYEGDELVKVCSAWMKSMSKIEKHIAAYSMELVKFCEKYLEGKEV